MRTALTARTHAHTHTHTHWMGAHHPPWWGPTCIASHSTKKLTGNSQGQLTVILLGDSWLPKDLLSYTRPHRRQVHEDLDSRVETPNVTRGAFVMSLFLGNIPCPTPHSSPFSFKAMEAVLFVTFPWRELGPRHCSHLRSSSPPFLCGSGTWVLLIELTWCVFFMFSPHSTHSR